jgi:hypothetical protein
MTSKDRFLILETKYFNPDPCVLIADYRWWNKNEFDIKIWAKECLDSFVTEGMVIKFATIEDRNMFIMRWSHG